MLCWPPENEIMRLTSRLAAAFTLVTDNRKDFPMPELSFYPWD
jgi:hypothetical protein